MTVHTSNLVIVCTLATSTKAFNNSSGVERGCGEEHNEGIGLGEEEIQTARRTIKTSLITAVMGAMLGDGVTFTPGRSTKFLFPGCKRPHIECRARSNAREFALCYTCAARGVGV
ncbi:hypothetical protein DFH07DRAFT_779298 [Mycena maculata]|uniref:Uncharacterized protein n=1 Tax=Mycena maculata TaxID=230809 RepID=A0AAD7IAA2_9AGAR|nr:hypothetical protein DFH07DRAFT_779298 [Mycena maculata]